MQMEGNAWINEHVENKTVSLQIAKELPAQNWLDPAWLDRWLFMSSGVSDPSPSCSRQEVSTGSIFNILYYFYFNLI